MRPRTLMIVGSLALHALAALAAFFYAGRPKQHESHSIAVMGEKKKQPPKPIAPPPPPRPKLASRSTVPAPAPTPAPVREPARPVRSAPTVGGTMSNDASSAHAGPPSGTGTGGATPIGVPQPATAAKPIASTECTELPSKAQPVSRPTEIEYTQQARADGIEGRLVLRIVIGADGAVTNVIVVSSVDPALDAAAIAAVKSWVFKPAMRCGKPMAGSTFVLAQRFELGD